MSAASTQPDRPIAPRAARSTEIADGFVIGAASWGLFLLLVISKFWFLPLVEVVPSWRSGPEFFYAASGIMALAVGAVAGLRGRSIVGLAAVAAGFVTTILVPSALAGYRAPSLWALTPQPLPVVMALALGSYWIARRRRPRAGVSGWLVLATIATWLFWAYVALLSRMGP